MPRDVKTFRLTEFKGLNTSVNPHNIDDAEMPQMINIELTKDRTLQTRKGYTILDSSLTNGVFTSTSMSSMHRAIWDSSSPLYVCTGHQLWKYNVATDTTTYVGLAYGLKPGHTQFKRYKDRILVLYPGQSLKWFSSAETLADVKYPRMKVGAPEWSTAITASAGGSLVENTKYQYTISLKLGSNQRDGETMGALPGNDVWVIFDPHHPWIGKWVRGDYATGTTTASNKTLTATDLIYSGKLYGFAPSLLRLFRRVVFASGVPDEEWVLVDEALMELIPNSNSYQFTWGKNARITIGTSSATVSNDTLTISLDFTDSHADEYDASYKPRAIDSEQEPKAKYIARMNNRIFLANIEGKPQDKKLVWMSYRPGNPYREELSGFLYDNPMLIFPPGNCFYCDVEDIEDEITGMSSFQDNIIIFTERCMFLWREGMTDPAKLSNDVGCVAHHTIKEFEGKLIWLARNGVYTFDGTTVKNISYEKVNYYIERISMFYAGYASACIYNRRYWLTAPYGSGTNDQILVYDFDLDEWHLRQYTYDGTNAFRPQYLYTYRAGNDETLYGSGISATGVLILARMEDDYADNGNAISASLKTKYFDFNTPDVQKQYRALYLDFENYSRGLDVTLYIDSLNSAAETITYAGSGAGFILNDNTGQLGILNQDYIVNVTDELIGFSINRNMIGSRIQLGATFQALSAPTKLHAIAIDWRPMRKVKKRYGDGS